MPLDDTIRSMLREEIRAAMREELRALIPELRAPTTPEEFLSVLEATRMAKVSPATVRSWLRRQELKRYGTPRLPRIRRAELVSFLANPLPTQAPPASIHEQAEAILSRSRRS
jgi:hypothetical protein